MSHPITATHLRTNIYQVLDEILETGIAQEVKRGDSKLVILPTKSRRRLKDRPKRDGLNCTLDELVATSWVWNPDS